MQKLFHTGPDIVIFEKILRVCLLGKERESDSSVVFEKGGGVVKTYPKDLDKQKKQNFFKIMETLKWGERG